MSDTFRFDPQPAAEELWSLLEDGNCIAWVGSGLSRPLYKCLEDLLPGLCDVCRVDRPGENESFEDVAQRCKDADTAAYHRCLASEYGTSTTQTRIAYTALVPLNFKCFITTNFDPLLGKCGETHDSVKAFAYPDLPLHEMRLGSKPMYYIHGRVQRPDDPDARHLVLARSDFEAAYSQCLNGFLREVLMYHKVAFFGCRLTEESISKIFGMVHRVIEDLRSDSPDRKEPRRMMLFPVPDATETGCTGDHGAERMLSQMTSERNRFEEMRITVQDYPDANDHAYLDDILRHTLCLQRASTASPTEEGRGIR